MSSAATVFEKSVCFNYVTRVFSVNRDAAVVAESPTRKRKAVQTIINPKLIRTLGGFKQEAFRACRANGTKLDCMGVWLVPEENERILWKALETTKAKWDDFTRTTLFPQYKRWVQQHAEENKAEAADIIALAPSLASIRSSTRFVFQAIRLRPADIRAVNLEEELLSLPEQAVHEIAAEIKDCGLAESEYFTQGTKRLLQRISRKSRTLAYLHPRLEEMTQVIDRLLQNLPSTGAIRGNDALAVRAVIDAICNCKRFMKRGFAIADAPSEPEEVKPVVVVTDVKRVIRQGDSLARDAGRIISEDPVTMGESPCSDEFAGDSSMVPAVTVSGAEQPTSWNY